MNNTQIQDHAALINSASELNIGSITRKEWIEGSGVTEEYFEFLIDQGSLRYYSPDEAQKALGFKVPVKGYVWGVQGCDPFRGTFIAGKSLQIKTNDDQAKYRSPKGAGSDFVFLPLPDGRTWEELILAGETPVIVEGAKKAAALISRGVPAICCIGVHSIKPKDSKGNVRINAAWIWTEITKRNLDLILCFDMDLYSNDKVKKAFIDICNYAEDHKVNVASMQWNPDYKGIDDLIAANLDTWKDQTTMITQAELIQRLEKQFSQINKKADNQQIAEDLVEEFRAEWKFHQEHKTWRKWNSQYWESIDADSFKADLLGMIKSRGYRLGQYSRINDIALGCQLELAERKWIIPDRKRYIAFQNGIYDRVEKTFEPHNQSSMQISCLPRELPSIPGEGKSVLELMAEYTPITLYNFDQYVGNDQNKVLKLMAVINATLLWRMGCDLQRFVYLIGKPGTGKGTFMRLLTKIVGEKNVTSKSLENLGNDYHLADVIDKQLVLCADEDTKHGGWGKLKTLTGGDSISFRQIYKEPGSGYFHGSIIVAANDSPFSGNTNGIDRRMCILKFDHVILERDSSIEELMDAELDYLVAIALMMDDDQVKDLINDKYDQSDAIAAKWQDKINTDSVASWMDDHVMISEYTWTPTGSIDQEETLYHSYVQYCTVSKHAPVNVRTFGQRLQVHGAMLGWDIKPMRNSKCKGWNLVFRHEDVPSISDQLAMPEVPEEMPDVVPEEKPCPVRVMPEVPDVPDTIKTSENSLNVVHPSPDVQPSAIAPTNEPIQASLIDSLLDYKDSQKHPAHPAQAAQSSDSKGSVPAQVPAQDAAPSGTGWRAEQQSQLWKEIRSADLANPFAIGDVVQFKVECLNAKGFLKRPEGVWTVKRLEGEYCHLSDGSRVPAVELESVL